MGAVALEGNEAEMFQRITTSYRLIRAVLSKKRRAALSGQTEKVDIWARMKGKRDLRSGRSC